VCTIHRAEINLNILARALIPDLRARVLYKGERSWFDNSDHLSPPNSTSAHFRFYTLHSHAQIQTISNPSPTFHIAQAGSDSLQPRQLEYASGVSTLMHTPCWSTVSHHGRPPKEINRTRGLLARPDEALSSQNTHQETSTQFLWQPTSSAGQRRI
jgi:hypothetical protein